MTKDIFQLSRFVTLHSVPLIENIQPTFCSLRGVLVLVFASQVGNPRPWQRRKFFIFSDIVERVKRNGKIWHISVPKLRHCQLQRATTALTLCCVDAMLCADWLVSITDCIFWDLIGPYKLSYIFEIGQNDYF